jgi:hypothetical protein
MSDSEDSRIYDPAGVQDDGSDHTGDDTQGEESDDDDHEDLPGRPPNGSALDLCPPPVPWAASPWGPPCLGHPKALSGRHPLALVVGIQAIDKVQYIQIKN